LRGSPDCGIVAPDAAPDRENWTVKRLPFVLPVLALLWATGAPAADLPDKQALEQAIRSYLLEHPEVIVESLQKYDEKERAAQERASNDALLTHKDKIYSHPMTPVTGNPKGDVTVVEFFDYQCGYCKRTMQNVLALQKEDAKIRFLWKELPILGPASEFAARGAMAAEKQGKYLEYHVAVMGTRGQLTPELVLKRAAGAGIDIERLKHDMDDPAITKYLRETLLLAQQLGITGTPGFIIGGKLVPGAIDKEQMKKLVANARAAG
jgi:protein-disulfide isomerase